jgi:exosortase
LPILALKVHDSKSSDFMATGLLENAKRGARVAGNESAVLFLLKAGLVVGLIADLFSGALAGMAKDWWTEPAYSQGLLLPPLALYLVWVDRKRTLSFPAVPDRRGLWLTAFACLSFTLGSLSSEFFLMRIAFVILLAGLVWTFWGSLRLRSLAVPLLLLATMVPLPVMVYNSVAGPLQLLSSDLATRIAQAVGVSVFRDGNVIQLADMSLGVAEACSGLNSLSALVVGSLLLGYLICGRTLTRIALLAIAVPLAIGVNVLRVAGTAVLADYNMDFALGFYHLFSGWLFFVAGFGLLYGTASLLRACLDPK